MRFTSDSVLSFWFSEIPPKQHWAKDPAFDAAIASRFGDVHAAAVACELQIWRRSSAGRLAEIIVLDQFSRNIYRDQAQAFAADSMALVLAQEAIASDCDKDLADLERAFLYMPFMHSESARIHEQALELFDQPGLESNRDFERRHKEIIDRFGRYPHRNKILGRTSSPEELAFLAQAGSRF